MSRKLHKNPRFPLLLFCYWKWATIQLCVENARMNNNKVLKNNKPRVADPELFFIWVALPQGGVTPDAQGRNASFSLTASTNTSHMPPGLNRTSNFLLLESDSRPRGRQSFHKTHITTPRKTVDTLEQWRPCAHGERAQCKSRTELEKAVVTLIPHRHTHYLGDIPYK